MTKCAWPSHRSTMVGGGTLVVTAGLCILAEGGVTGMDATACPIVVGKGGLPGVGWHAAASNAIVITNSVWLSSYTQGMWPTVSSWSSLEY